MQASKPVLGYWKIRGLGANLRFQLAYCGVEYEMVEYEQGDGPEFSRQPWLDNKFNLGLDFPNLPYFKDGDFSMTETMPIHQYIAEKWKPELIGKDAQTKAEVNQLANVITNFKMKITMPCYMSGDVEEIKSAITSLLPAIVDFKLNKGSKFISGDQVSWLDFYFVEVVCAAEMMHPAMMTEFPNLVAYKAAMFELPGLKEYISSPDCIEHKYLFNNKVAKINNKLA